ncbi:ferritin family protein [Chloroflexota bacterium]
MAAVFSGSELINIAIGIEKRGIAFYDVMARSADNATARSAFQYLCDMEREHVKIFQGMFGEADKYQPVEAATADYAGYLQALIDSAVFTDDLATSEVATHTANDLEALELAIGVEKDSILFYYQLGEVIPQPARSVVSKIIAEEKLHLRELSDLKKRLASGG